MLDVYQALAGRLRLAREPLDLRDVARHSLEQVAVEASGQGVNLNQKLPAEPVPVEGDPNRLAQLFAHLLGNAVRHTPAGGQVELRLEREGNSALVTVRDTGEGIAPDLLPRLFTQFAEAGDPRDSTSGTGLRLGLTLVQRLVQLHGGTVAAVSKGQGRGSTFTVRLPLRADVPPAPAPAAPTKHKAAKPRRVLVVEDNPDGRRALQMMLQLWGHEVEAAGDGSQGVQKALADPPDVALVDIGLPGLDGYEVARRLRAALGSGVVLIALTAFGEAEDIRRASRAGFDHHLTKPAEPGDLLRLLRPA